MAERSAFSMSRATDFLVKRRMDSASLAFLPRMRAMTRPAFWAEVRTYLAVDFTSRAIRYPCLPAGAPPPVPPPAPALGPPGAPGPPGPPGAPATLATFSTLHEWPLNCREVQH